MAEEAGLLIETSPCRLSPDAEARWCRAGPLRGAGIVEIGFTPKSVKLTALVEITRLDGTTTTKDVSEQVSLVAAEVNGRSTGSGALHAGWHLAVDFALLSLAWPEDAARVLLGVRLLLRGPRLEGEAAQAQRGV